MESSISVITPAADRSLVTVFEVKKALNLLPSDTSKDDQLELLIKWASAEIEFMCMRVFARETVIETFTEIDAYAKRIFLSYYPVQEILSINDNGFAKSGYLLDEREGKLTTMVGARFLGPVVEVTYTGGYELPFDAPEILAQGTLLLVREAYYAALRGDASIRMIGHKESRVMYFDPSAQAKNYAGGGAGGKAGSAARGIVENLIQGFIRYNV